MKTLKIVGILLVFALALSLFTLAICVKSIDKHEYGFTFNRFTGEITPLNRTGLFFMNPIKYAVHKLDLRPYQIRITANVNVGERILNAKLVRFNPDGLKTFIAWHGRKAGRSVYDLTEILKCYAFAPDGGKSCPFLKVEAEIAPSQGMSTEK